ncbi:hypothetical protein ACJQWK_09090 [Exserohilum turcicum]
MFNQKLFQYPRASHELPNSPSSQNEFLYASPVGKTVSSSFNQYPVPSMPDPFNHSSSTGYRSQSRFQPTRTPSAADRPLPFGGFYFQNLTQANEYLGQTVWFPSMGSYGFPQTDAQYRFYLQKICLALSNTEKVWDEKTAPWQFEKFMPTGEWTGPVDIEAIAHNILYTAFKIHIGGVTSFAQRLSVDYMSFNSEDIDCTFTQRIHFLALLLGRSKAAAADIMAKNNTEKYVATPITALRTFTVFDEFWKTCSPVDKKLWLEAAPYAGSGVMHPPEELQIKHAAVAQARYQKALERQKMAMMCISPPSPSGNAIPVTGHHEASLFRKRSYTASSGTLDSPMAKHAKIGGE